MRVLLVGFRVKSLVAHTIKRLFEEIEKKFQHWQSATNLFTVYQTFEKHLKEFFSHNQVNLHKAFIRTFRNTRFSYRSNFDSYKLMTYSLFSLLMHILLTHVNFHWDISHFFPVYVEISKSSDSRAKTRISFEFGTWESLTFLILHDDQN